MRGGGWIIELVDRVSIRELEASENRVLRGKSTEFSCVGDWVAIAGGVGSRAGLSSGQYCSAWCHPMGEPNHSLHIVQQVDEADFGCRTGQADGANEQAHGSLLAGEDVLDRRAYR